MILKVICIFLSLSVVWVSGASFSNVYVRSGSDVSPPVNYMEYGVPSYTYNNPQIAQVRAPQVASVYPLAGYETPCVPSPCLYPDRTIATVGSVGPSANIVAYQPPVSNVPVAVSPNVNDQSGYEYMYTIYNEPTGDHKLHSELSNGGVVRGEYAFLQPDGLIREVQYVADDVKGFNAIVKNLLPSEKPKLFPAQPCLEEKKSEPLIQNQDNIEEVPSETSVTPESPVTPETQNVPTTQGTSATPELVVAEISLEVQEPSSDGPQNIEVVDNTKENTVEGSQGVSDIVPVEESPTTQQDVTQVTELAVTVQQEPIDNLYIPYNDVIKCIQAALKKLNQQPSIPRPPSPLTYLVFNKPC